MAATGYPSSSYYLTGGLGFLSADGGCLPEDLATALYDWDVHIQNEDRDLIDLLDEAANTDEESWCILVTGTVELIEDLMNWFIGDFMHACFDRRFEPTDPDHVLFYYRSWAFGARLAVCIGWLHKMTAREIDILIQSFSNFCDECITSALALYELRRARAVHREEINRLEDIVHALESEPPKAKEPPVDLDDIAQPFEIKKSSKDDDDDDDDDEPVVCPICTEELTDKSTPIALECGHVYDLECLQEWIQCGHNNSHTCCICRRELFPKPDRSGIEAEMRRNEELRNDLIRAQDMGRSFTNALNSLITLEVDLRQLRPARPVPNSLITGILGFGALPVEGETGDVSWDLGNPY